jgi:hypothetical protein
MNRVMNALRYSVASYLRFGRSWGHINAGPAADALWHVANCHRKHVRRIGELLIGRHWHVESRAFPLAFTGLNELSIGCILPLSIEDEKQIISLIEASAVALKGDSEANELAAEVVDSEQRHLQTLQRASDHCSITSDMSARAKRKRSVWPVGHSRLARRKPSVAKLVPIPRSSVNRL